MNLTDCDDAFMKQKELLFLPLVRPLLDFQIQRYFIPAPPHLCNHQHFLTHGRFIEGPKIAETLHPRLQCLTFPTTPPNTTSNVLFYCVLLSLCTVLQ
ncbi:hypothetical protein KUCAC02_033653 [Chaenocephalus aceratus]|nr:hypothetical protein KUCAC02_033653 [Chaenocephalus aceratus]